MSKYYEIMRKRRLLFISTLIIGIALAILILINKDNYRIYYDTVTGDKLAEIKYLRYFYNRLTSYILLIVFSTIGLLLGCIKPKKKN